MCMETIWGCWHVTVETFAGNCRGHLASDTGNVPDIVLQRTCANNIDGQFVVHARIH